MPFPLPLPLAEVGGGGKKSAGERRLLYQKKRRRKKTATPSSVDTSASISQPSAELPTVVLVLVFPGTFGPIFGFLRSLVDVEGSEKPSPLSSSPSQATARPRSVGWR